MKTPIRKQKAITYSVILVLLGGCNLLSPIKDLKCTTTSKSEFSSGASEDYTINTRTGEWYETDKMTGKLQLINGKTSDVSAEYETRTDIANNEWKMETISTDTPDFRGKNPPYKRTAVLNLKTMEMIEKGYKFYLVWEEIDSAKAKCEWVKPKTTEILQEPKT